MFSVISALMEDIMTIIKDGSKNLMSVLILNVIADVNKKKISNNFFSYFSIIFIYKNIYSILI